MATFPLSVHATGRYLVDGNGAPFLLVGDSPQGLLVDLTTAEMATFFANRQSYGFNAQWVHVTAGATFGGRSNRTTYDGIAPFTNAATLTPNATYFSRLDTLLSTAATYGQLILLTAAEFIDSDALWQAASDANCTAFGEYLGTRYADTPNLLWAYGNDYITWDTGSDVKYQKIRDGIASVDSTHLHTIMLDYLESASRDDSDWENRIDLDLCYTYYPTYDLCLTEYAKSPVKPIFLGEANYEDESNHGYLTTPLVLRLQNYWAMTSGCCGVVYGHKYTWPFLSGWADEYDSTGAAEVEIFRDFFAALSWHLLVPDTTHSVLTAGYGTYCSTKLDEYTGDTGHHDMDLDANSYATCARASDGSAVVVYIPAASRTVTIDMTKIAGSQAVCRWFNPRTAAYTDIGTYATSGTRQFTSPAGSGNTVDSVLLLTAGAPIGTITLSVR